MRRLLATLFTVNMWLTAIVLVMCLALLTYKAFAEEVPAIKTSPDGTIKVMVIDTGIDGNHSILKHWMPEVQNKNWESSDISRDYKDSHGHGTHVTGLVIYGPLHYRTDKNGRSHVSVHTKEILCKQVQIYSCKYYDINADEGENLKETISCFKMALDKKMNVVNYSGGGEMFYQGEYDAIKDLQDSGIPVIAAAGNNGESLESNSYYPASYSSKLHNFLKEQKSLTNVIPVGALKSNGKDRLEKSNYLEGKIPTEIGQNVLSTLPGNQYGYMSGTSQAAPTYLHKLLLKKCKELNKE